MPIRRVKVRSLAKVNLDLRILHKRRDGFHELRTVFQTISLADTLDIEYQPSRRTILTIDGNIDIPDNLVIRAAQAVLDAMKITARVQFRLRKRIPMGGGLGGGSSNAAAVLLALPVLAGVALTPKRLTKIAAGLGSDVPFFLIGGTVAATGRGTDLCPLPDIAEEPILVATTGIHVATGPAYAALGRKLTFTGSSFSINAFDTYVRELRQLGSATKAQAFSANDFEPVVFGQHPLLSTVHSGFRKMKGKGRLSGSGSAVFGLYRRKPVAEEGLKKWKGEYPFRDIQVVRASLVSRSRYERMWRRQLREHLVPDDELWPPRSRYAR
jgi:4-diphosphocytidyl-2-C-methyl-D-erythritol kinase